MNGDNKLINVFNNTIEALEEYIEKIDHPGFKKQIFGKSINSPDRSSEDLADDFFCQLYILKAMITVTRKKPEYSHQEVQKSFYQWIDVAGIKVDNCPKDLKHYLFTINEVLEGRGEDFAQQTDEKNEGVGKPDPKDLQELYNLYNQQLHNPSKKKEVNIQGNAETGKEIFQQIVNFLPDSDRQNFRFYPEKNINEPTDSVNQSPDSGKDNNSETPNQTNNTHEGLSWSSKLSIGGTILVALGILTLLIVKISKKKKKKKQISIL